MEDKKDNILDLTVIVPMLLKRWKLYALCIAGVIVFSLVFVFTIPRYYACKVMLAPEATNNNNGLNSLMNSFGLGDMETTDDAISPKLYPDLMTSNDFIVSMFPVEITTKDGELTTTYYDYLLHYNKNSWYGELLGNLAETLKSKDNDKCISELKGKTFPTAFLLTDEQHDIANLITNKIQYDYDKKTGVISVTVKDQDPLVCALIADTVSSRLQDFIMDYRTKKARNDLEYAQRIYAQTKADYEESNERYVAAVDANWDIVNETAKARLEALSNEKTLKYQTFSTVTQKLEGAKAKLQEATPVITVLQGSSVPQKPAGPKRLIITLVLMFLACFVCTAYLIVKSKEA
jgi:uncharacterized protein involved in exopolysaccharide biosynthesis